jgi:hypothetical protein
LFVKHRDEWQKSENKSEAEKPNKDDYWQPIPSENLYFFADKIFNMNLNFFKPPEGQVENLEAIKKLLTDALGKIDLSGVTVTQITKG